MNTETKISRKEFLSYVGGMMLTVLFFKFIGIKRAVSSIRSSTTKAGSSGNGYGNGSYGGKSA